MHSYNLKFSVNKTFKGLTNDSNITSLTKTQQTPLKDKFSEKDPQVKQRSGGTKGEWEEEQITGSKHTQQGTATTTQEALCDSKGHRAHGP